MYEVDISFRHSGVLRLETSSLKNIETLIAHWEAYANRRWYQRRLNPLVSLCHFDSHFFLISDINRISWRLQ